jgi:hypothetical protein
MCVAVGSQARSQQRTPVATLPSMRALATVLCPGTLAQTHHQELWSQAARARARADILRDALKPVDQVWLADRFRVAAVRRYARLEAACDDQLPLSARARRPALPAPLPAGAAREGCGAPVACTAQRSARGCALHGVRGQRVRPAQRAGGCRRSGEPPPRVAPLINTCVGGSRA